MTMATYGGMYSGDSSYKYIDRLIKNWDRELRVISPYISSHYARMLAGAGRRKRVMVITSRRSLETFKSHGFGRLKLYIKLLVYLALLDAIAIYLNFFAVVVVLSLFVFIDIALFYRMYRSRLLPRASIKVATSRFVHEKLYISNSVAITGSANLTFQGTHRNIEHIEIINDPEKISRLRSHFDRLWKSIVNL